MRETATQERQCTAGREGIRSGGHETGSLSPSRSRGQEQAQTEEELDEHGNVETRRSDTLNDLDPSIVIAIVARKCGGLSHSINGVPAGQLFFSDCPFVNITL